MDVLITAVNLFMYVITGLVKIIVWIPCYMAGAIKTAAIHGWDSGVAGYYKNRR